MTEEQIQTLIQFQKDILAENEITKSIPPEERSAVTHAKLYEISTELFNYAFEEFSDPRVAAPSRQKELHDLVHEYFENDYRPDTLDADVQPEMVLIVISRYLIQKNVQWSFWDMKIWDDFAVRNHTLIMGED